MLSIKLILFIYKSDGSDLCVNNNGLILPDHLYKLIKQVSGVMWAGGCFRMVLNGEGLLILEAEAHDGVVIEMQVRYFCIRILFNILFAHGKSMVLLGDLPQPGKQILNGIIQPPMSSLQ